jgi:chorismate synthase
MTANSFGNIFKIHSFGESHGEALGVVIDGCPAGVTFDFELLKSELERRRPGGLLAVSQRKESDIPEVLSGVFGGKTLGTPIAIIVRNQDAKASDYETVKNNPRAGHADDVWQTKFGHRDHRGGGRSSGRETVARVMGGAVAKMLLKQLAPEMFIFGFASQVGPETLNSEAKKVFINEMRTKRHFVTDPLIEKVQGMLKSAQASGDSFGGIAELRVFGMSKNLGQPVFHKLKSDIAAALMSIGAVAGLRLGDSSDLTIPGTQFHTTNSQHRYGGIRGGLSTGEDLIFQVEFKPTSSILDVAKKGRHDPCIIPRAIPVLESMLALVLADHFLWTRLDKV